MKCTHAVRPPVTSISVRGPNWTSCFSLRRSRINELVALSRSIWLLYCVPQTIATEKEKKKLYIVHFLCCFMGSLIGHPCRYNMLSVALSVGSEPLNERSNEKRITTCKPTMKKKERLTNIAVDCWDVCSFIVTELSSREENLAVFISGNHGVLASCMQPPASSIMEHFPEFVRTTTRKVCIADLIAKCQRSGLNVYLLSIRDGGASSTWQRSRFARCEVDWFAAKWRQPATAIPNRSSTSTNAATTLCRMPSFPPCLPVQVHLASGTLQCKHLRAFELYNAFFFLLSIIVKLIKSDWTSILSVSKNSQKITFNRKKLPPLITQVQRIIERLSTWCYSQPTHVKLDTIRVDHHWPLVIYNLLITTVSKNSADSTAGNLWQIINRFRCRELNWGLYVTQYRMRTCVVLNITWNKAGWCEWLQQNVCVTTFSALNFMNIGYFGALEIARKLLCSFMGEKNQFKAKSDFKQC